MIYNVSVLAPSENDITSNYREALTALAKAGGGDAQSFPGIECVRSSIDDLDFNIAFVKEPRGVTEETLRQVLKFYREIEVEWCFSIKPGLTVPLSKVMKLLRISRCELTPEMILKRKDAAFRKAPPSLEVRTVSGTDELRDWARVAALEYGNGDTELLRPMVNPTTLEIPRLRLFAGLEGDRTVSTSASYVSKRVAGVYAVRTIPGARGRGYGEALSAAAAGEGFSKGCAISSLQASSSGFPIYYRMGFRHTFDYQRWVVKKKQTGFEPT